MRRKSIIQISISISISILLFLTIFAGNTSALEKCETYDPVTDVLTVKCDINFIQLANELNDSSKIAYLGNGEWLLDTTITTIRYTTFRIDTRDGDLKWLKIAGDHGIIIGGKGYITGVKITSWDSITNETIMQDKKGSIPRAYISYRGSNGGIINYSDIGYLGFKKEDLRGVSGVSFYDSHGVLLSNNMFHDIYFAFYSSGSHNITIDNNEYYHNLLYAIDPHTDSYNFTISNNHVHYNYKFGIIFSLRCSNFLVENNTIHDNNQGKTGLSYGIFFSRMSDHNIARNNTIFNETIGIDLSQSSNNEVYGNKIYGTTRGIYLKSDKESIATGNYVHDNEIYNSELNIDIVDSRNNTIENNTNTMYGAAVTKFDNENKYSLSYIYDELKLFLNKIFGKSSSSNSTNNISNSYNDFSTNYLKDSENNTENNYENNNIGYTDESEPMKNATVILSFDDGSRSVYDNAYPILKANNQKAVVYIVANRPDRNSRGYMNWTVLRELYNHGWDVSSHTVNHVDLKTVNDIRLSYELNMSQQILLSHGFERSARFIAYPFGGFNDKVVDAVKANGYLTARTTSKKNPSGDINGWQNEKALYTMSTFELHNYTTTDEVIAAIDKTIAKGGNLILVYHIVTPNNFTIYDTQVMVPDFKIISDYIASRKNDISVITMSEYYNSLVAKSQSLKQK